MPQRIIEVACLERNDGKAETVKIMSVVGARPNFIKIAPLVRAIERFNDGPGAKSARRIEHLLVHTGQHYEERMSRGFFDALGIPRPDVNLGIGSGTHAEQVGRTMIAFEKVVRERRPDWVVVVGDVNATCACSITTKKEHVKLAHIEAGLRSFDLDMPEEINRMVTDRLSDALFTTDNVASENLRNEGAPNEKIKLVGNIMIDTLMAHRHDAAALDLDEIIMRNSLLSGRSHIRLEEGRFAVLTMHRPSNVDDRSVLGPLIEFLVAEVAREMPLVWPMHPRTRKQLETFGLWEEVTTTRSMLLLNPIGYHEMLKLNMAARIMLTDSGGLQEECCVLGTPCLTLRWNTERPVTLVEHGGVSVLVGSGVGRIREGYNRMKNKPKQPHCPPLWDGHTAERIVDALATMG